MRTLTFIALSVFIACALAHSAQEWKNRAVYQLLTDRFAKSDGSTSGCDNLSDYCGGTFKGIMDNLDYIQGLGFDAIWISPVIQNNPGGYHGYWAQDIYAINSNFGTEDDLKALVQACHDRDIWVMVDVVANHMGPMLGGDFSDKNPFNSPDHYHQDIDCSQTSEQDQAARETCWLAQLPDLNQDNDYVRSQLLSWISDLVSNYGFDGLRIDTVPYVSKDFWREFSQSAGVYTIGEVFNGYVPYDAGYEGPIDALLNYPLYFKIKEVFQGHNSMNEFQDYYSNTESGWPDISVLGTFVDNHDNARFLNGNGDHIAFKSALAFSLTAIGIPMFYYGSEAYYGGGNDPANREVLWTNMDIHTDCYDFVATINNFRKSSQYQLEDQVQRYASDQFYAFTRGVHFVALTNNQGTQQVDITFHPYSEGETICNIFDQNDCLTINGNQFTLTLNSGEVKIYTPKSQ